MATQQSFSPLQKLFAPDLTNLAYNSRYGVKSGCKVIESPVPAMSVRVQAGQVYFDAATVTVAQQDLVVTAADPSYDRYDLVLVDNAGICSVLAGTAAAAPVTPVYDADLYTCLAIILVDQAVLTIVNAKIRDSRSLNFRAQTGLNFVTFVGQTSVNVVHSFGTYPEIQVVDNTGNVIDPQGILHNTVNDYTVTFGSSTSGTIIYSGGAIALVDTSKVSKTGDNMVGTLNTEKLAPHTDALYDLGDGTHQYRDLFLSGDATVVGDVAAATVTTPNGLDSVKGGYGRFRVADFAGNIAGSPPAQAYVGNFPAAAFDDTTQENLYFEFQSPVDIDTTQDIVLEIVHSTAGANTSKNIVLGLDVNAIATNQDLTPVSVQSSTTETISVYDNAELAKFDTTTTAKIPTSIIAANRVFGCKLYRKATDVADDCIGDWYLIDVVLKYKRL